MNAEKRAANGLLRGRSVLLVTMLTLSALTGGCEWYGHKVRNWQEDVLLEDGTTIRIKRHVTFVDNNALGGGAYSSVERTSTLTFPEWMQVPQWKDPLIPLLLYRQDGRWAIVSTSMSCDVWRKRGRPRSPYWEHQLIDGIWREVPLSEASIGGVPNLFFDYGEGAPDLIGVQRKREILSDIRLADVFTMIRRESRDFFCN